MQERRFLLRPSDGASPEDVERQVRELKNDGWTVHVAADEVPRLGRDAEVAERAGEHVGALLRQLAEHGPQAPPEQGFGGSVLAAAKAIVELMDRIEKLQTHIGVIDSIARQTMERAGHESDIPSSATSCMGYLESDLFHAKQALGTSRARVTELEHGIRAEIAEVPDGITVREGGGFDDVLASLAVSVGRLKRNIDEARSNSVPGLSHSVLTTYGAPNGPGLTLLGRIEALGDKCDRSTERWTKADDDRDRLRGQVTAMRDQLKVTQGLLMARVGRLSVSQSGEVIGDIRALLESDAGAPEAAVVLAAVALIEWDCPAPNGRDLIPCSECPDVNDARCAKQKLLRKAVDVMFA